MTTKTFFTPAFYENPNLTLDILNQLFNTKQVADHDMYKSGTFLYMEVYENEQTKELLSKVISDLEAYKAYNAECFVSDETTEIGLCALQNEHHRHFGYSKEIKWDAEIEEFFFAEDE